MFGIGMPELVLILVIALVVLGPDKLPGLAKAIGRGIGEFKRATDELKKSIDQDEELKGLKDTLNQAKNDVTDMVRDQMRSVQSEDIAKALENGTLFGEDEKKPETESTLAPAPEEGTETPLETAEAAGDEATQPADSSEMAATHESPQSQPPVKE